MSVNSSEPSKEPALAVGVVTAVVTAALGLVVSFGLPLTDAQQSAILGVTAALAPLIGAWVTRGRVFSPATVAQLLKK